jgi:hypothetical protein
MVDHSLTLPQDERRQGEAEHRRMRERELAQVSLSLAFPPPPASTNLRSWLLEVTMTPTTVKTRMTRDRDEGTFALTPCQ